MVSGVFIRLRKEDREWERAKAGDLAAGLLRGRGRNPVGTRTGPGGSRRGPPSARAGERLDGEVFSASTPPSCFCSPPPSHGPRRGAPAPLRKARAGAQASSDGLSRGLLSVFNKGTVDSVTWDEDFCPPAEGWVLAHPIRERGTPTSGRGALFLPPSLSRPRTRRGRRLRPRAVCVCGHQRVCQAAGVADPAWGNVKAHGPRCPRSSRTLSQGKRSRRERPCSWASAVLNS